MRHTIPSPPVMSRTTQSTASASASAASLSRSPCPDHTTSLCPPPILQRQAASSPMVRTPTVLYSSRPGTNCRRAHVPSMPLSHILHNPPPGRRRPRRPHDKARWRARWRLSFLCECCSPSLSRCRSRKSEAVRTRRSFVFTMECACNVCYPSNVPLGVGGVTRLSPDFVSAIAIPKGVDSVCVQRLIPSLAIPRSWSKTRS